MDSLPQEIVDEIIDNLPHSSLRSSSLVAKRWRKRSQQRALNKIDLRSEFMVNRWHIDTRSDPGGISSCIQSAGFPGIVEWKDRALFSRILRNFNSLRRLRMSNTEIPNEVLEDISRGEFGDRITALYFWDMRSSFVIPMILVFPNLQTLVVHNLTVSSTEPPFVHPAQSQRRTLDSLQVAWCTSGAVEALENLQLTASRLILDVQTENVQKLLIVSSLTVVELVLLGLCLLCVDRKSINDDPTDSLRKTTSHLIDLPPFPVLTSLKVLITAFEPSPHLINTLSPISSAPALESVELECLRQKLLSSNTWGDLDG